MKQKDFKELKTKEVNELKDKISALEIEIVNDNLELKMGKLKNVHGVLNKKKDIARIKTLLIIKDLIEKQAKNKSLKLSKKNKEEVPVNAAN